METREKTKSELISELFEIEEKYRIETRKPMLSEDFVCRKKLKLYDMWCVNEVKFAIDEAKARLENAKKQNKISAFYETEQGKAWKLACENQLKVIENKIDALKTDVEYSLSLYIARWLGDGFVAKFNDLAMEVSMIDNPRISFTLHFRNYAGEEIKDEEIYVRHIFHSRIFVEKDEKDIMFVNALSKFFTDKEKYHNLLIYIKGKVSKLDELRKEHDLCYKKSVNPLDYVENDN